MKLIKTLHLMPYSIKNVTRNVPYVAETGFNNLQIAPVQNCKPLWTDNGRILFESDEWYDQVHKDWWLVYQILNLIGIGNFLGSEADLYELHETCKKYGITLTIDIVLRHLAGDDYGTFTPYHMCQQDIVYREEFWQKHQFIIEDYKNRWQETHGTLRGLPALDYDNPELQEKYYIPLIKKIGQYCEAIRLDMAKHYKLPSEGGTFYQNVIDRIKRETGLKVYGECPDVPRERLKEYCEHVIPIVSYAESFGLHGVQRYVESHDTQLSTGQTIALTDYDRIRMYEDMLSGTPEDTEVYFYARRKDKIMFSNKMKEINWKYN